MNNIDRIFSEQLGSHTSAPPVGAWERVEMTLSRRPEPACPEVSRRVEGKRPATSSWRWAAILVPVVVAGGWMMTRTEPVQQVATVKSSTSPIQTPVTVQEVKHSPMPVAIRRKPAQPVGVVAPSPEPIAEIAISNPEAAPLEEITIEPVELIEEAVVAAPAPTVEKPIVIVITLDPVVEAPDADKKALTRVAEFAMAVKHSDPLGSLRGVKEELLALDLRKKSTKKN